jgi:signal transduction histidine kinase
MKLPHIRFSYIFIILAFVIISFTATVYLKYNYVEDKVIQSNLQSNIEYVNDITTNISTLLVKNIKTDFYEYFKKHPDKIKQYETYLQLFITNRYKYVYLLEENPQKKGNYRFILDGTLDKKEKSEFSEPYEPLEIIKWEEVYKTKKPVYFTHHKLKNLWMTYLKPIVRDGKIDAILVIDFSMKYHNIIVSVLKELDNTYEMSITVFIIIFFIILLFSLLDIKREHEKDEALHKVEKINIELEEKIKEAVEENRKLDQAMFQQSRLAQMGEMLSMIAHQWRQPLSAISSTATALKLKATLNKADKQIVIEKADDIVKYSKHLSSTIDDFRSFFKSNKDKKETDLNDIVTSVLNITKHSLENKSIELIVDTKCKKTFYSYPNELKQVLLNLIKNAEDALLEKKIKKPKIYIKTYESNDKLVLEVLDNAGGIEDKIMERIFDLYFSTKIKKDGTGLGLYMSKIIVEEHCRGRIEVKNIQNGAMFKVILEGNNA